MIGMVRSYTKRLPFVVVGIVMILSIWGGACKSDTSPEGEGVLPTTGGQPDPGEPIVPITDTEGIFGDKMLFKKYFLFDSGKPEEDRTEEEDKDQMKPALPEDHDTDIKRVAPFVFSWKPIYKKAPILKKLTKSEVNKIVAMRPAYDLKMSLGPLVDAGYPIKKGLNECAAAKNGISPSQPQFLNCIKKYRDAIIDYKKIRKYSLNFLKKYLESDIEIAKGVYFSENLTKEEKLASISVAKYDLLVLADILPNLIKTGNNEGFFSSDLDVTFSLLQDILRIYDVAKIFTSLWTPEESAKVRNQLIKRWLTAFALNSGMGPGQTRNFGAYILAGLVLSDEEIYLQGMIGNDSVFEPSGALYDVLDPYIRINERKGFSNNSFCRLMTYGYYDDGTYWGRNKNWEYRDIGYLAPIFWAFHSNDVDIFHNMSLVCKQYNVDDNIVRKILDARIANRFADFTTPLLGSAALDFDYSIAGGDLSTLYELAYKVWGDYRYLYFLNKDDGLPDPIDEAFPTFDNRLGGIGKDGVSIENKDALGWIGRSTFFLPSRTAILRPDNVKNLELSMSASPFASVYAHHDLFNVDLKMGSVKILGDGGLGSMFSFEALSSLHNGVVVNGKEQIRNTAQNLSKLGENTGETYSSAYSRGGIPTDFTENGAKIYSLRSFEDNAAVFREVHITPEGFFIDHMSINKRNPLDESHFDALDYVFNISAAETDFLPTTKNGDPIEQGEKDDIYRYVKFDETAIVKNNYIGPFTLSDGRQVVIHLPNAEFTGPAEITTGRSYFPKEKVCQKDANGECVMVDGEIQYESMSARRFFRVRHKDVSKTDFVSVWEIVENGQSPRIRSFKPVYDTKTDQIDHLEAILNQPKEIK